MITADMRAQMRRLVLVVRWRIETVARRFGVHHSTVRRALDDAPAAAETPFPSAVDPFKPYIVHRLTEYPELTATRLLEELRARGYDRGLAILRRYVAASPLAPHGWACDGWTWLNQKRELPEGRHPTLICLDPQFGCPIRMRMPS